MGIFLVGEQDFSFFYFLFFFWHNTSLLHMVFVVKTFIRNYILQALRYYGTFKYIEYYRLKLNDFSFAEGARECCIV